VLSTIEGLNLGWQRNIVLMVGQVVLLIMALLWIPRFGLPGLYGAQVLQALLLLAGSFVLIWRNVDGYRFRLERGDGGEVRRVLTYGMRLQAQAVLNMLSDPVTKMFLSRFGGLSAVGYFDIASRLILQLRQVLLGILQSLLPRMAGIQVAGTREHIAEVFHKINTISLDAFVIAFGGLFIFCPVVFDLWVGRDVPTLNLFCRSLIVAWFVNACVIVPYLFNLGSGRMRGNIVSHAIIACLNVLLGALVIVGGGSAFWFVFAHGAAIIGGSVYLIWATRDRGDWLGSALAAKPHLRIWLALLVSAAVGEGLRAFLDLEGLLWTAIAVGVFIILVGWAWRYSDSFRLVSSFVRTVRG
jgi:O-antigen/teichoic acid export membrane protein